MRDAVGGKTRGGSVCRLSTNILYLLGFGDGWEGREQKDVLWEGFGTFSRISSRRVESSLPRVVMYISGSKESFLRRVEKEMDIILLFPICVPSVTPRTSHDI